MISNLGDNNNIVSTQNDHTRRNLRLRHLQEEGEEQQLLKVDRGKAKFKLKSLTLC